MVEYIKRETLVEWLKNESDKYSMKDVAPVGWTLIGLINELHKIPNADVAEHKRGKWGYRWKVHGDGRRPTELFPCTECGYENTSATNFCPNCGADMREEEENAD